MTEPSDNTLRRSIRELLNVMVEGLRTTTPTASNPYWRSLSLRRMKRLFAGTFLLASVVGFATNITVINQRTLLHGFFWPVLIAFFATGVLLTRLRRPRWTIFVILLAAVVFWRAAGFQASLPSFTARHNMERELFFDAVGIWIAAAIGSRLLISFLTTQGAASVRMQTELALAHGIQSTLVPAISLSTERFEIYGISIPSTEMGGDLVDVVEQDRNLLAYVADVSGHGLPAGQLMGMLKTAMRLGVELRQQPVALLESADRVLPGVKQPEMYATLALLRFDSSMEAEYCVAGHPAIIHYRKNTNDAAQLAMEQFPLGLVPYGSYASARTSFSSGDVFAMITDGIIEVANESGEEFGLGRVRDLVVRHAADPLPNIWRAILSRVTAHGPQRDDQSGLFIRVV